MVSDEGACAAYYTYGRFRQDALEQRDKDSKDRKESKERIAARQGQAQPGG
jgi:hypothetical protein